VSAVTDARHRASPAPTICPAGHPVASRTATRCPTCGRLLRPRYERLCAQGHVVTSANGVCPYCGDRPAEDRTPHYLFLGAAIAFLLFVVLALAVDLPQQIIDWAVGARDWLGEFIDNLPALIG